MISHCYFCAGLYQFVQMSDSVKNESLSDETRALLRARFRAGVPMFETPLTEENLKPKSDTLAFLSLLRFLKSICDGPWLMCF